MTVFRPWLPLALALSSTALAADPATTIWGLIAKDKVASAQSKCTKWNAQSRSTEPALREACADAFWLRAAEVNTVSAWMGWRQAWQGTSRAPQALEREAERALYELGMSAAEPQLLAVAKDYAGTKAGEEAQARAANAVFLRVDSDEDAREVCETYRGHAKLLELVQRRLGAFIEVQFHGTSTDVTLMECATLPAGVELKTNWVTRDSQGRFSSWSQSARELLIAAGLAPSFVDPLAAATPLGKPAYPVCFDARLPQGMEVGVQVTAGQGNAFVVAPWNEHCNEQTPPVFAVLDGEQLAALSLRPGHVVSIGTAASREPGGFFPSEPGPARLIDGHVVQPVQPGLFYVQPLTGTSAWWLLADRAPLGGSVLPLSAELQGTSLPRGWQVQSMGHSTAVSGPELTQAWMLPAGEARALSPLVQRVTGLTRDYPGFRTERAPALPDPATTRWTLPLPGHHSLTIARQALNAGPPGAVSIPITPLGEHTRANAGAALAQVGVVLEVLRAWEVQLDTDAPLETLWESTWQGKRMRLLTDPMPSGLVRVFPLEIGHAGELTTAQTRAFAFQLGTTRYVATTSASRSGGQQVEALHLGAAGLEREVLFVSAPASN